MKVIVFLTVLALSGCSGMTLKGESSLTLDNPDNATRHNLATAGIKLCREYRAAEVCGGYQHISDVQKKDQNGGTNGLIIEMTTTLWEYK